MNNMFYIGFGSGLFLGVALAIIFYILKVKDALDYTNKLTRYLKNMTKFMEENNKEEEEDGTTTERHNGNLN